MISHSAWLAMQGQASERHLIANMFYLDEHGLIVSCLTFGREQHQISLSSLRITAKGLDFLEKDGGLGAILNVVNVKIHEDTLAKLEAFIAQAPLTQKDKTGLIALLKQLPAFAIEHLTHELMDLGLEQTKEALPLIQRYAGKVLAYFGSGPSL